MNQELTVLLERRLRDLSTVAWSLASNDDLIAGSLDDDDDERRLRDLIDGIHESAKEAFELITPHARAVLTDGGA